MAIIKKYHGNKTNALHFMIIAYKKLRCHNPYENLEDLASMIGL
jgi:hypothetical protein